MNDRIAIGLEAFATIVDRQPGSGLAPHGESHGSEHAIAEALLTHPVQLGRICTDECAVLAEKRCAGSSQSVGV